MLLVASGMVYHAKGAMFPVARIGDNSGSGSTASASGRGPNSGNIRQPEPEVVMVQAGCSR